VANRPILFHHLEALRSAGVFEATIAVEPESARLIGAAVGDGSDWNLSVRYVDWAPASGVPGALAAARSFLADEPVIVRPGDALQREQIHPHIADFAGARLDAMALRLSGDLAGGYLLSERAVGLLVDRPHLHGEDPLAGVRRHGGQVLVRDIDGCLACHGDQDTLLDANRRMLEDLVRDVDVRAHPGCEFQGPVKVHPSAQLEHTLVRGPAIIGPHARLSHAYVGPYTSIGAGVRIEGSQIEHSIVLDQAELLNVGSRLETSVIGRGARITRRFVVPTAMRLSVGDGAEVTVT
jgi:glucose-1-phosphate thymidylyltransferase